MRAHDLQSDAEFSARLNSLQEKFDIHFAVAHDSTLNHSTYSGWESDYAVLDLTAELPPKSYSLPEDLYVTALELFNIARSKLTYAKLFFVLRVLDDLESSSWTNTILLGEEDGAVQHQQLHRVASDLVQMRLKNSTFKAMYGQDRHSLVAYMHSGQRVFACATEPLLAFLRHTSEGTDIEYQLLKDECNKAITTMGSFFLGNTLFFAKRYAEAIEQWHLATKFDDPEAFLNIAMGYSKLRDMQSAFEWCKGAVERGVSASQIKNDPDLEEFRAHTSFREIRKLLQARDAKPKLPVMPVWKIPKNIQTRVDAEDGMWEDERFDPILLTVMSGVEYEGRDIPLSWQIEFDPFDDRLGAANKKLESSGIEPDGDGWAEVIQKKFAKRYPKLAGELHSDSESSTCVLWVESENACQKLIELVWSMIYAK